MELGKSRRNIFRIVDIPDDIRTEHRLNTTLKRYSYFTLLKPYTYVVTGIAKPIPAPF
jgi:hypothetical protein